ncbi:MAG: twitching motility protein PilT [Gammaproteobacteria bacterium]|nr:twitching motility protein PilT [Gammaproteobacteria bacterium]
MTDSNAAPHQCIRLRFYEELNDFLPQEQRRREFSHRIEQQLSITDLLAYFGVPRNQVDLVLVDDEPVDFTHRVGFQQRVAVFPVFERCDISPSNRLRPKPLRRACFVLDQQLEKLARLLRLAGFDSLCRQGLTELQIIAASTEENRVILSRDRELLKNARVSHAYWLRESDPPAQFREIVNTFDLRRTLRPFSRCMDCNGELRVAEESEVLERIPFAVLVAFDDFWQCEECRQVYWKGSHYERMAQLIETI